LNSEAVKNAIVDLLEQSHWPESEIQQVQNVAIEDIDRDGFFGWFSIDIERQRFNYIKGKDWRQGRFHWKDGRWRAQFTDPFGTPLQTGN
jgi:hypothetical protein